MPIFEYECKSCGHQFEFLKLASTPEASCPQCQSRTLERLMSGFAPASREMTKSRVKAARKQMRESSDYKDRKVAEIEAEKHHLDH